MRHPAGLIVTTALFAILATTACDENHEQPTAPQQELIGFPHFNPDHYGVAEAYAPIIHQYLSDLGGGDYQDQISLVTYDADWDTVLSPVSWT